MIVKVINSFFIFIQEATMSLAEGMLFSYLWDKRKQHREDRAWYELELAKMESQRDALKEVVQTLVPEYDVRQNYVIPLYLKLLRQEYVQRGIPIPSWLRS
jgi:hypothetical protein